EVGTLAGRGWRDLDRPARRDGDLGLDHEALVTVEQKRRLPLGDDEVALGEVQTEEVEFQSRPILAHRLERLAAAEGVREGDLGVRNVELEVDELGAGKLPGEGGLDGLLQMLPIQPLEDVARLRGGHASEGLGRQSFQAAVAVETNAVGEHTSRRRLDGRDGGHASIDSGPLAEDIAGDALHLRGEHARSRVANGGIEPEPATGGFGARYQDEPGEIGGDGEAPRIG